jgi:hypothetical protein
MITIKKEDNGTYSARVRYKDAYGNVHQKRMNGYTRKKDLEDDYAKLIANPAQVIVANKKDKQKTLSEVFEEWKLDYKPKVRHSTLYDDYRRYKHYLEKPFGNRAISKISRGDMETYLKDILTENNKAGVFRLTQTIKKDICIC